MIRSLTKNMLLRDTSPIWHDFYYIIDLKLHKILSALDVSAPHFLESIFKCQFIFKSIV